MVRLKHRYLLVNILYPELEKTQSKTKVPDTVTIHQATAQQVTGSALVKGLKAEIATLFGDFGTGAIAESLNIRYWSNATSTLILRVTRAHYKIVWAALSLMTKVPVKDGKNCVFQVIRVSGTIRKAEEECIRRAREIILKARREAEGRGDKTLDNIFGKEDLAGDGSRDVLMVDRSDSEGEMSDDDG